MNYGADKIDITSLLKNAQSFHSKGNLDAARQLYNKILSLNSRNDEALHLLGVVAAQTGDFKQAIEKISQAIVFNPNSSSYYSNLGNAQFSMKNYKAAILSYDKAIKLNGNYAQAYCNRGNALREIGELALALKSYDAAINLDLSYSDALYNRGIVLFDLMALEESIQSFKAAIRLDPSNEEAYYNLGVAQQKLGAIQDAIISYTKAIQLKGNYIEAYCGRGNVLRIVKNYQGSTKDFLKAIEINPDHSFIKGYLLHSKALSCDWDGIDNLIADINLSISFDKKVVDPFTWQATTHSIQSLTSCSKIYSAAKYPPLETYTHALSRVNKNNIRIGYLSGEFGDQATSHLLVGLLENHNKNKFDIICFDNGANDGSGLRKRIESSVEIIHPIKKLNDKKAAQLIYDQNIDILINLNGYFGGERNSIFAIRPAPIQVNYLGFPGTLSADYIDYIIADKIVLPEEEAMFYSEKVIFMPDSYQPTDRNRIIGESTRNRSDYGLPDDAFVFCCFNNSYKITPDIFNTWMNILHAVKNGVIWLLEDSANTSENLKKEALLRKIDPKKLIFAPRINCAEHLARHKMADLFLDTLPCNAHTTASDALWTGTPILTCSGKTFAGRVAHSLLSAIDLPELITYSLAEYETKAIELALDNKNYSEIKNKLQKNRLSCSLFDTRAYTKNLEKAFEIMHKRRLEGLTPECIDIANELNPDVN